MILLAVIEDSYSHKVNELIIAVGITSIILLSATTMHKFERQIANFFVTICVNIYRFFKPRTIEEFVEEHHLEPNRSTQALDIQTNFATTDWESHVRTIIHEQRWRDRIIYSPVQTPVISANPTEEEIIVNCFVIRNNAVIFDLNNQMYRIQLKLIPIDSVNVESKRDQRILTL